MEDAAGRVFAYSGDDLLPIPDLTDPVNDTVMFSANAGDQFGYSVAGADDLSGDEHDDILVGAWRATYRGGPTGETCPGGNLNGAVYVIAASDGTIPYTLVGARARDRFGWDVDAAHFDSGGVIDIISAGMGWSSPTEPSTEEAGKAYLYLGENLP